jgi:hypothetical protein
VPGYLVYLLFIFLPGIGFGELLNVWRAKETLAERIALAFALGLSIDTIVFLIKTSGFAGLVGLSVDMVYLVIGLGIVAIIASVIIKKKITFPVKPVRIDLVLLAIMMLQGLMLLVYFQKYPIFPEYFTQDPTVHVNYVESLISGSTRSIPSGLLYFGVHYQLASGVLLVGGEPLVIIQRIMAILVTISPLLFFYASKKLFSSERAALVITIIYAFSGMVWYAGVFDSGLYPNFFGILAALFLLIAVFNVAEKSSVFSWIVFAIALVNGYMSHYTFLTLLPALIVLPLLKLSFARNFKDAIFRRYSIAAIICLAPAAIPFLFYPHLASRILYLATSGGGVQAASTFLSNAFSAFPVLSFLAVEMEDDVALIICLLLTAVFIYRFVVTKDVLFVVPLVWFVSLFIAAPFNISAWRFSYESLVPLTFMSGFALYSLLPASIREGGKGRQQSQRRGALGERLKKREQSQLLPLAIVVILFGTLLIGSWGQTMLGDALTDTAQVAQSQNDVYQAIYWLKANTPNGSQYLAVSDWRFTYSDLMIGRLTHYEYIFNVTNAIEVAKNTSSGYILVTNIVTANVPNVSGFYPWDTFPSSTNANLTLIYSNPDVRVFQLAQTT